VDIVGTGVPAKSRVHERTCSRHWPSQHYHRICT